MTFPKVRPFIFGGLFLAWLGFLLYLVIETKSPLIARPQFQVAQAVLVVSIRDDDGKADPLVAVKEVLKGDAKAGQQLRLLDLLGCKKEQGYAGAGDYVIPLMQRRGEWQIVPLPIPPRLLAHPSHGTLEIRDGGPRPECVLWRLTEYARQKPDQAEGLLEPLMPSIATCYLGNAFFGEVLGPVLFGVNFHWPTLIDLPRGRLPCRLPIADAVVLKKELEKCKADVDVIAEEVRIYPLTPEVRAQAAAVIAAKKASEK